MVQMALLLCWISIVAMLLLLLLLLLVLVRGCNGGGSR